MKTHPVDFYGHGDDGGCHHGDDVRLRGYVHACEDGHPHGSAHGHGDAHRHGYGRGGDDGHHVCVHGHDGAPVYGA